MLLPSPRLGMELLDLPGELLLRIVVLLTSLERIRLLGACRRLDTMALLCDGQLLALDCPSMGVRKLRASGLAFLLRRAGPGLRSAVLAAPCCSQLGAGALLAALEQPCAGQLRNLVAMRLSAVGGNLKYSERPENTLGPFFSPQGAARLAAALPHLGRGSVLGLACAVSQLPSTLAALHSCGVYVQLSDAEFWMIAILLPRWQQQPRRRQACLRGS